MDSTGATPADTTPDQNPPAGSSEHDTKDSSFGSQYLSSVGLDDLSLVGSALDPPDDFSDDRPRLYRSGTGGDGGGGRSSSAQDNSAKSASLDTAGKSGGGTGGATAAAGAGGGRAGGTGGDSGPGGGSSGTGGDSTGNSGGDTANSSGKSGDSSRDTSNSTTNTADSKNSTGTPGDVTRATGGSTGNAGRQPDDTPKPPDGGVTGIQPGKDGGQLAHSTRADTPLPSTPALAGTDHLTGRSPAITPTSDLSVITDHSPTVARRQEPAPETAKPPSPEQNLSSEQPSPAEDATAPATDQTPPDPEPTESSSDGEQASDTPGTTNAQDTPEEDTGTTTRADPVQRSVKQAGPLSTSVAAVATSKASPGRTNTGFADAYLASHSQHTQLGVAVPAQNADHGGNDKLVRTLDDNFQKAGLMPFTETKTEPTQQDKLRAELNRGAKEAGLPKGIFPAETTANADQKPDPPSVSAMTRAELKGSPILEIDDKLRAAGWTAEQRAALRQELRSPAAQHGVGKYRDLPAPFKDYAWAGTVSWDRFRPPDAKVDKLIHQALGRKTGEYIPQKDLHQLAVDLDVKREALRNRGLSDADLTAIGHHLDRTGHVFHGGEPDNHLVIGPDGITTTADEYGAHRLRQHTAAIRESPVTWAAVDTASGDPERATQFVETVRPLYDALGAITDTNAARATAPPAPESPQPISRSLPNTGLPPASKARVTDPHLANTDNPNRTAPEGGGIKITGGLGGEGNTAPRAESPTGTSHIPKGMSLHEMQEPFTRERHYPNAIDGVPKQPGLDWVNGARDLGTTQTANKKGDISVTRVLDGGTWIAGKQLKPADEVKSPTDQRVRTEVKKALRQFEDPVKNRESSRRVTMDDGSKYQLIARNPEELLVHVEVPGYDQMSQAERANLGQAATDALFGWVSPRDGTYEGIPIQIRITDTSHNSSQHAIVD